MNTALQAVPEPIAKKMHDRFVECHNIDMVADELMTTGSIVRMVLDTFDDTRVPLDAKFDDIIDDLEDNRLSNMNIAMKYGVDVEVIEAINDGTHDICASHDQNIIYPIRLSQRINNRMLANMVYDIIVMNMKMNVVARKYLMSYRTIRHISAGDDWYNQMLRYPLVKHRKHNLNVISKNGADVLYLKSSINHSKPSNVTYDDALTMTDDVDVRSISRPSNQPFDARPMHYIRENNELMLAYLHNMIDKGLAKKLPDADKTYGTIDGDIYTISECEGIEYVRQINPSYEVSGSTHIAYPNTSGDITQMATYRAIAMAFVPNDGNSNVIHHINHIRCDNRSCNLVWTNHHVNMWEKGKFYEKLGESNITDIMSDDTVEKPDFSGLDDERKRLKRLADDRDSSATDFANAVISIDDYLNNQKPFNGCVYLVSQKIKGEYHPAYVGMTFSNPVYRLKQHYDAAYQEYRNGTKSSLFHRALCAYPAADMKLEVLELNIPYDSCGSREQHWITTLDTYCYSHGYGYNEYSGDSYYSHNLKINIDDETRRQIVDLLRAGKEYSEIADKYDLMPSYIKSINVGNMLYDCSLKDEYPINKKSVIFSGNDGDKIFLDTVRMLQENKMSSAEIAKATRMSSSTISTINRGKACYDALYQRYSIDVPIRVGRSHAILEFVDFIINYAKSTQNFYTFHEEFFPDKGIRAYNGLDSGSMIMYKKFRYPLHENDTYNKQVVKADNYRIDLNEVVFSNKGAMRPLYYVANRWSDGKPSPKQTL